MAPLGLSANALALALRVPATRIGAIIRDDSPRAVSADTGAPTRPLLRHDARIPAHLQTAHDLSLTVAEVGARIEHDVHPRAA